MRRRLLSLFCAVGIALTMPINASPSLTPEQIREARHNGSIRPLKWVLHQIQSDYPGRVLDADLKQEHGLYLYKITLLQHEGHITKLTVDANTAEVLQVKTRKIRKRKH